MAIIDQIVQIQITRQTTQVDITSFDIPLLLVEMDDSISSFANDRVRTYTSLPALSADLGPQHAGYLMATKLLGGQVKPNQFKVGKVNVQSGAVETYVEALQDVINFDDTWYAVITESHLDDDINSVAGTIQAMRKLYFTSTSSQLAYTQNQSVVYTAEVQFDLPAVPVSGDSVSVVIAGERYQAAYTTEWPTTLTFSGSGSGSFAGTFDFDDSTGLLEIENTSVNYVVSSASQVVAGETIVVPASDISLTDPVGMDIGQRLKAKGFDRTIILFSNTADADFPEAAWVGGQLPKVVGSITWEYKQLPGVTVSRLTDSQIQILEARGYNYYIPVKGVNITRRGKVADGDWIDELQIEDWLYARFQEQIFYRLVNTGKLPMTDVGATIVENEMRSVLTQGQANGAIDTFSITVPRILSIPENQRAARILGDFKFEARLQGAVSIVVIRGNLTV